MLGRREDREKVGAAVHEVQPRTGVGIVSLASYQHGHRKQQSVSGRAEARVHPNTQACSLRVVIPVDNVVINASTFQRSPSCTLFLCPDTCR